LVSLSLSNHIDAVSLPGTRDEDLAIPESSLLIAVRTAGALLATVPLLTVVALASSNLRKMT
jgi:hypothetical protein